jgi:hypothetical protein
MFDPNQALSARQLQVVIGLCTAKYVVDHVEEFATTDSVGERAMFTGRGIADIEMIMMRAGDDLRKQFILLYQAVKDEALCFSCPNREARANGRVGTAPCAVASFNYELGSAINKADVGSARPSSPSMPDVAACHNSPPPIAVSTAL